MSRIYVSEFPELAATQAPEGAIAAFAVPALASYAVIVSAGVSKGQTLNPLTKWVELSTDTTASFRIDTSGGTCTLTDTRLAANERLIRRVNYQAQPVLGGYGASVGTLTTLALYTTANA